MTTTLEDSYTTVGTVREIPLDKIRPSAANPRSELGDLDGLAQSIRETGVLQPITVVPAGDGDAFEILYGARRHAASKLAGKTTIPAIVQDSPADRAALVNRIIENLQRENPSALDEANAFQRLRDEFGVDQYEIADRVGCSQSHISKRLSLLTLPEKAREMVGQKGDDGRLLLTLDEGVKLARLADHPDRLNNAVDHIIKAGWDPDRAVEHELAAQADTDAMAAEVAKCVAAGITVLWTSNSFGLNAKEQAARDKAIGNAIKVVKTGTYGYGKQLEFDKPATHTKEPCHRVVLTGAGRPIERVPYCVDPKRHAAKGESKLKTAKKLAAQPKAQADPAAEEQKRIRGEIAAHRTEFVTDLVRNRKYDRALVTTLALKQIVGDCYNLENLAELLGLDVGDSAPESVIGTHMNSGSDALLRTALAALLSNANVTSPYATVSELDLLTKFGYQPSDLETDQHARRTTEHDAYDAYDRIATRAEELNEQIDPAIVDLLDELETATTSVDRMREIGTLLDTHFAELNNLQPGDVVDVAPDGGHTIERAEEPDIDEIWAAYGAVHGIGSTTCIRPIPPGEEPAAQIVVGDQELELLGIWPEKPPEVDVLFALQRARSAPETETATAPEMKKCPYPACMRATDHMGDHVFPPDPEDLELNVMLTDYAHSSVGPMERQCRELIKELNASDPIIIELQQELYRGLSAGHGSKMRKRLRALVAEQAK